MAYISKIGADEAEGALARELASAERRSGRIWEIVAVQSQNGEVLRSSMRLYGDIMFGPSPLSRAQREMLAVTTSTINECVY